MLMKNEKEKLFGGTAGRIPTYYAQKLYEMFTEILSGWSCAFSLIKLPGLHWTNEIIG